MSWEWENGAGELGRKPEADGLGVEQGQSRNPQADGLGPCQRMSRNLAGQGLSKTPQADGLAADQDDGAGPEGIQEEGPRGGDALGYL